MIGAITAGSLSAGVYVPTTPVAGYNLWLDASDASTFTYSSGSLVSAWNDKSASAKNFTQSTTLYQPTRNTGVQNGKAAVAFNASALLNTTINWGASNSTVFFVLKQTTTTGYQNLFTTGTGTTGDYGYGITDPASGSYFGLFRIGQASVNYAVSPTGSNADVICFKGAGANTNTNLYKNGTAAAANPKTITGTANAGALLGSNAAFSEYFRGYFCEVLYYPSQLSDSDRNLVEAYLKAKWGTP